jgi:hypothetical protein
MSDEEPTLPTETFGDLNPPPTNPPTAIGADAAGDEPRPSKPWPLRRRDVPNPVARAIDSALDALDKLGDAIRSATRPA